MSRHPRPDAPGGETPMDSLLGTVSAAEFQARCLQIMDRANETGTDVTITRHGHPVAKLVPMATKS